jgi:predicted SnoaL-like aldol condensation-catalyzing enzyme
MMKSMPIRSNRLRLGFLAVAMIAGLVGSPAFAATAKHHVTRDIAAEERNRALVIDWYDRVFNRHDLSTTAQVLAEDYVQHNPTLASGRAALVNALPDYWLKNPGVKFRFLRSAAAGDLVFLHSHRSNGPADLGRVYVDIYRVVHGKIVEHWDVSQPVPATSANSNESF